VHGAADRFKRGLMLARRRCRLDRPTLGPQHDAHDIVAESQPHGI
jgi:hypothetical protein